MQPKLYFSAPNTVSQTCFVMYLYLFCMFNTLKIPQAFVLTSFGVVQTLIEVVRPLQSPLSNLHHFLQQIMELEASRCRQYNKVTLILHYVSVTEDHP